VESISENGFDDRYGLQLSRTGRLSNKSGAHRLSCSLVLGLERIPVSFLSTSEYPKFPISWFISNGFEDSLIREMRSYLTELLKRNGIYTVLILWPDSHTIADEIESFVDSKFSVIESKDIIMDREKFRDFARNVYQIDDVDPWKPEYKIHRMERDSNSIRVLLVDCNHSFRQKDLTKSYLNKDSEKLKSAIRTEFRSSIENYFYDNLVHSGDNHIQNSKLYNLIWSE